MANSKRDLFSEAPPARPEQTSQRQRGTASVLSVHRSNKNISAQLIDDVNGVTLASASSLEKDWASSAKTTSKRRPKLVQQSQSGPRKPVWKYVTSTVAAFSFTAKSRLWPTLRVKVA